MNENGLNPKTDKETIEASSQTSFERRCKKTFADKKIKREKDFRAVYHNRIRAFNERLALCCRATSPNLPSRLGLSVSKKVGKAFVRNRWKRLLREAFRQNFAEIPQGFDFIAIPQRQEKLPSFETLAADLRSLAIRCVKKLKKRENTKIEQEVPLTSTASTDDESTNAKNDSEKTKSSKSKF